MKTKLNKTKTHPEQVPRGMLLSELQRVSECLFIAAKLGGGRWSQHPPRVSCTHPDPKRLWHILCWFSRTVWKSLSYNRFMHILERTYLADAKYQLAAFLR